jgi:hypothetical protein
VSIHFTSDWSEVDRELDRLIGMPDPKAVAKLDAVLKAHETLVLLEVHVDTGSLKASIKSKAEVKLDTWIGTISAGGPSTGVKNPVKYAIYEKRRGGDHDFFGNLHLLKSMTVDAIKEALHP